MVKQRYIDLCVAVQNDLGKSGENPPIQLIRKVLGWLDDHPKRVQRHPTEIEREKIEAWNRVARHPLVWAWGQPSVLGGGSFVDLVLKMLDDLRSTPATVTESELEEAVRKAATEGLPSGMYRRVLKELGITVVPDPTNAEQLTKLLDDFADLNAQCGGEQGDHDLATFLDAHGVTAPGGEE